MVRQPDTSRTKGQQETFPAAAWWREDVELSPMDRTPIGHGTAEPPPREEREAVLRDIGHRYAGLAPKVDLLMRHHRRYADTTGDVFYLVRTACNVGMRLLRSGIASETKDRGNLAVSLARLAFEYDPANVYAWSLMRDALAAAGRLSDAELIGWETIRRFPENEQWRNQLATILAGPLGDPQQAADLLKAAIADFPANAYARTQLATILAGPLGDPQQAADLLKAAIADFPADAYARSQLATVLADDLGNRDQAREVLRAAVSDGASDDATKSLLAKLEQGRRLRSERRRPPMTALVDESSLSLPAAAGRRILFRFEAGRVDRDAVRTFLAAQQQDGYLTYVGERVGIRSLPFEPTFALAFDRALRDASPSALRALVARARPMERELVEEAVALSEGRVVQLTAQDNGLGNLDRLRKINEVLGASNNNVERKKLLLRDVAASYLSQNMTMAFAA